MHIGKTISEAAQQTARNAIRELGVSKAAIAIGIKENQLLRAGAGAAMIQTSAEVAERKLAVYKGKRK